MQPGSAVVCDNWKPTLSGVSLRGGFVQWCVLPETTPVISAFEYASGTIQRMFAGNATNLYNVSTSTPAVVEAGQTSGNYAASQMANAAGDFLIVVNDAGDPPLRYNGTVWTSLAHTTPANWANSTGYVIGSRANDPAGPAVWKCAVAHTSAGAGTFAADRTANPTYWTSDSSTDSISWITGPAGTPVEHGSDLTYVCKYRNRLFFVEKNSMNAWYLPLNAVGGALALIPLSGAATKGGKLLFCAVWSIDAGDGIDDKIVFCTDLGELLIFTGSDPSSAANWRQEGRYDMSAAAGHECARRYRRRSADCHGRRHPADLGRHHQRQAELELAAITRTIRSMWRDEALDKREYPWTLCKWDEYGGIFVTLPGGLPASAVAWSPTRRPARGRALPAGTRCAGYAWAPTCFLAPRAASSCRPIAAAMTTARRTLLR